MKTKLLLFSFLMLMASCVKSRNIDVVNVEEKSNESKFESNGMKLDFTSQIETREYSVEKRTEFSNPQNPSGLDISSITEDVSITFDKSNALEPVAKVEISNVKQDGKRRPDNPINQYFLKSGEVLNKIDLSLSSDGRIQRVVNRDEILQNWEYIKIYLDNYFVSENENVMATLKGWTQQIEETVKNEDQFIQTIENDLFYNRFFYGYWMNYSLNGQLVKNQSFPAMFGNALIVLTDRLTASDIDGKRQVEISGKLNREASDMVAIAEYLGMDINDLDDLSIESKGKCLFDAVGLIEEIEFKAEAEIAGSDFKRSLSLTVRRR